MCVCVCVCVCVCACVGRVKVMSSNDVFSVTVSVLQGDRGLPGPRGPAGGSGGPGENVCHLQHHKHLQ